MSKTKQVLSIVFFYALILIACFFGTINLIDESEYLNHLIRTVKYSGLCTFIVFAVVYFVIWINRGTNK